MKKIYFQLLALALFIAPLLWSCEKDEAIDEDASISALIDGQPWNAIKGSQVFKTPDNTFTITAVSKDTRQLIMIFRAEEGNQTLVALGDNSGTDIIPSISYKATSFGTSRFLSNLCTSNDNGEIIITKIDEVNKTITGTFRTKVCFANSSVQITEGKLNGVKYN